MIAKSFAFGWRVYGLGVMSLGVLTLVCGTFDPGQTVPKDFPARTLLAYAAGALMVAAAAAVEWRRTTAWGAAVLTAYYALFVILLMNGAVLLAQYAVFGTYEELAIQLAIPAAGLIIYANSAGIDAALAARLTRIGQLVFGACALVWGAAHFVYMNLTAPLVPKWLPPSQIFWADATGVGHIAAGLAILSGVQARLAAILLTVMFVAFTFLVHLPMLIAKPDSYWIWSENLLNIALIGAAWVVADSLAELKR